MLSVIILSVIVLSVIMLSVIIAESHYAECHGAQNGTRQHILKYKWIEDNLISIFGPFW